MLASVGLVGGCNRNVAPPRTVLAQYEGPVRSRDVITGLNIYQNVCSVCHAGRVNPEGYHWSPGQMRQQIRRGNRLMPPLGHELLSDAQVEAVLAYLVGTSAVEGALPPLTREDLARERDGRAATQVARERRREELVEELDPELRPAETPTSEGDGAGRSETGPTETGPTETGPAETGPAETGPAETGATGTETGADDELEPWPAEGSADALDPPQ
ncbi:MAG: cytochrome c [Myxococcales bacterium]|nr:cytochrome c [Myxococcales bacterium]